MTNKENKMTDKEKLEKGIEYQRKAMIRIESGMSELHRYGDLEETYRAMNEITEAVEEFKRNMRSLET